MSKELNLQGSLSKEKELIELNKKRLMNRVMQTSQKHPLLKSILMGASLTSFLIGGIKLLRISRIQDEIEHRKQQIQKEEHVLNEEQSINLPWSSQENAKEWLHRRVEVRGRPIHAKQMMVPRKVKGHQGFDCIVPLVTKENEDCSEQYGMLMNMGWIPIENKSIENRYRIEDSEWQVFHCVVSDNQELQREMFQKGNNLIIRPSDFTSHKMNQFSSIDLPLMASKTSFKNHDQSNFALVEQVNIDPYINYDPKNTQQYNQDATQSANYPVIKNQVGCLQLKEMPWNLKSSAQNYFLATALLGSAAIIL